MKKFVTLVGAMLSIVVCAWITFQSKGVGAEAKTLNRLFLAGMLFLVGIAWISGFRKMNGIAKGLKKGLKKLEEMEERGYGDLKSPLFEQEYLDGRYVEYLKYAGSHGETDIREFINEYDIGSYTGKKFLEIVPDILTSAGILGTFIGLVVGLREFDPSGYQQMSVTMVPLIDGIKVAFLTSIYGISLSLSYSFGLSNVTENMELVLESFLEKFYFLENRKQSPYAEILEGQREQTHILYELSESFSVKLADRFEKIITPTFIKLGNEIDQMSENQKIVMKEAANEFVAQFQKAFFKEEEQFESNLKRINILQEQYMKYLSISTEKLNSSIEEEKQFLENAVLEMSKYFEKCAGIFNENIEKQKQTIEAHANATAFAGKSIENSGKELALQVGKMKENINETSQILCRSANAIENASGEISEVVADTRESSKEIKHAVMGIGDVTKGVTEETQNVIELVRNMKNYVDEVSASSEKIQNVMIETEKTVETIREEAAKFAEVIAELEKFRQSQAELTIQSIPSGMDMQGNNVLLLEMLEQMKLLVNLEQERQKKGFLKKIFRRHS